MTVRLISSIFHLFL